jgi:serine/threonine protein kinase
MKLTGINGIYSFNPQTDCIQKTGKFNWVFKGVNQNNEPVLIKLLLPELAKRMEAIDQFKNEFDLAVQHPNIICACDYVVHAGQYHIIRPWVDGVDMSKRLKKHHPKQAIAKVIPLLQALNAMHQHGVLHLDLQPKNVILGKKEEVYLTDLGLARKIGECNTRKPFNIYYSAPEQILNRFELFNATTDLYAVGMLLFELLIGTKPQRHQNPEVLMNLMLAAPLQNEDGIAAELFEVIKKATAKPRFNLPPNRYTQVELQQQLHEAQNMRYKSALEFMDALQLLPEHIFAVKPWYKFW